MNNISNSLGLERCCHEALPIPEISKFHCIEYPSDGSVNCCLYSYQSLMENRPPEVYPFDSDESDSHSFSEQITEDDNADDKNGNDVNDESPGNEDNVDDETT